jgi:hypothetical protein
MTGEPWDWTTPSQAEGERDDEPAGDPRYRTARSTPSQAEGEREETAEEGAEKKTGSSAAG